LSASGGNFCGCRFTPPFKVRKELLPISLGRNNGVCRISPINGITRYNPSPEEPRERVRKYAETLAQKPAKTLAAIRHTITDGGALSFEEGLYIEFESDVALADIEDFSEGIRAFIDKRKPKCK
jgi:hypothetical protein